MAERQLQTGLPGKMPESDKDRLLPEEMLVAKNHGGGSGMD
jgi:hypothetical protein